MRVTTRLTKRPSRRKPRRRPQPATLHEEISDLLSDGGGRSLFLSPGSAQKGDGLPRPPRIRPGRTDQEARRPRLRSRRRRAGRRPAHDEGLQSDRRFAESFVQSRINQGKGPVRIRLRSRPARHRAMRPSRSPSKQPAPTGTALARGGPIARNSARACRRTSRKRPGRCAFCSIAASSRTRFRPPWIGEDD